METRADSPAMPAAFQIVPLSELRECPLNPRKHFDQARLDELARSMAPPVGVLEPLLVRPAKGKTPYEIVAGARRFRAAQIAGLAAVPVLVRSLTDAQVLELMVIENNQRDDVHPLEEADGYAQLMALDRAYTVEAIAARTGKSASYIYRRLKLRDLIPAARQAFEADELTAAHAERLARLTPDQQTDALKEACFYPLFGAATPSQRDVTGGDDLGPGRRDVMPVSKLDEWTAKHTRVALDSPDVPAYFPELAQAQQESVADGEDVAAAPRMLELSESYQPSAALGTKKHGALGRGRWVEIGAKDSYTRKVVKPCEHAERGVVVHGGAVRVLIVCATKGCPVHFPERKRKKVKGGRSTAEAQQSQRARDEAHDRERARLNSVRHEFGRALHRAIDEAAGGLKKLDGRVLTVAAHLFGAKRVRLADLPRLLVLAAANQYGSYHVEELGKIAKALGVDVKPLQSAAEAKFPKPTKGSRA